MSKNPFVLATSEYKRDINIIKHYVDQQASYLSISTGKDLNTCIEFVKSSLRKGGQFEFKDPKIKYLERGDNGDRTEKEGTAWAYISESVKNRELISPTLTTYVHPDVKGSLLSGFLEKNVALRNKAKKEMFEAQVNKNTEVAQMKATEQKQNKLSNNSVSGMHCSPANPIYNETGHSTLTSNCRSTSGYGNANNEKFLAGNRHYYNHHIVLNNIMSIVTNVDYSLMDEVIKKYGLCYPSVEQTLDCIKYSSNLYWWESHYFRKIEDLVCKLTPLQRAAFVYVGDFYHLMKFNDEFVRGFLGELTKKVECKFDGNPVDYIRSSDEIYVNMAHQICAQEVKGFGKKYDQLKEEDVNTLACTVRNIESCFNNHSDLVKAFWVTTNMPSSMAYFPTSLRRVALTSDTDSTIFTVQSWIHWYRGYYTMDDGAIALIGALTALASLTIIHVLAMMSANFGIVEKHIHRIEMKNEYRFDVFVPTQLGKHYYANMGCQEGNVFEKHKMEIKGVYLKSSNLPGIINKKAQEMMKRITDEVMTIGKENPRPISIKKYIKEVADIERLIVDSIKNGETYFLKSSSIKDAQSYSKEGNESPYKHHLFWNEVFGNKYGIVPEPPYSTIKVSTIIENRTDLKKWLDSIQDPTIKNKIENWISRTGKDSFGTFNLPTQVLKNTGIPIEITGIINYKKIIIDLCSIFYLILETLGVYLYDDKVARLASDFY
jgi:hypothetical protein